MTQYQINFSGGKYSQRIRTHDHHRSDVEVYLSNEKVWTKIDLSFLNGLDTPSLALALNDVEWLDFLILILRLFNLGLFSAPPTYSHLQNNYIYVLNYVRSFNFSLLWIISFSINFLSHCKIFIIVYQLMDRSFEKRVFKCIVHWEFRFIENYPNLDLKTQILSESI